MISDEIAIKFTGAADGLNKVIGGVATGAKEATNAWKEAEKAAKAADAAVTALERDGKKGTDAWKQAKDAAKAARAEAETARKSTELSSMTYTQLSNHVNKLSKELKSLPRDTEAFKQKAKELAAAEKEFAAVKKQVDGIKKSGQDLGEPGLWNKITKGVGGIGVAFKAFFALQIVQFLWDIGKAIFETTGKFEKYETTLSNLLGSQTKAKEAMQALKDIAAKTPFSVDTLTDSYVKMVARGLRPSEEQIKRMGDAAAKMNKPFDQLMEAVLDVSNTERWNEIGIKVSKVGDKIKTNIGGSTKYFDATEQGAMEMAVAFGSTTDAMGLMEKQAGGLTGRWDSITDVFEQVTAAVGERLRPVFLAFLGVMEEGVVFLMEMVKNSRPLVEVFDGLWEACKTLFSALGDLVYDLFPGLKNQTASSTNLMKTLAVAFSVVIAAIQFTVHMVQLVIDGFGMLVNAAKAAAMALTFDMSGAEKAWKDVQAGWKRTGDHLDANAASIKKTLKASFVDYPKEEAAKGMLPVRDAHAKVNKEMTDTQKKELEKRQKAADAARKREMKAIDETYKQEQEALIAKLGTEVERERAKVDLKYELLRRAAERETKAGHELTVKLREIEEQRKADLREVEAKHLAKVKEANEKALAQIAEQEAQTKINSIRDELEREIAKIEAKKQKRLAEIATTLADERYKATLSKAIETEALSEIEKAREDHRVKEAAKEEKAAQKRLEVVKYTIDQQAAAEMALLDFKELQAGTNATKLAAIHKERVDRELFWTKEKLTAERDAELHKAELNIRDTEELKITQKAITDRYHAEDVRAEGEAAEKKKQIDAELTESKKRRAEGFSNAFAAILNGDVSAFAAACDQMVQGEKSAWQKRLQQNMAGYEAIAGMATQAVNFLNQLSQQRLETEMANLKKETDAKIEAARTQEQTELNRLDTEQRAEMDKLEKEWLANELSASELEKLENELVAARQQVNDEYQVWMDAARKAGNRAELDRLESERREELKKVDDTVKANKLGSENLERMEKDLADKKTTINTKYNDALTKKTKSTANEIGKIQNEQAVKEKDMKRQQWKGQQKADMATALINGALGTIKALASGMFPLNLVFAAIVAGLTAVQVAKIKSQPEPTFAHGGFVAQGGKHGARYGDGGIALVDRRSGREVGEMEGDEAIISADQTAANWPLIQQMFTNARTPGMRRKAVMGDRPPMGFRDGGQVFESPYWKKEMYLFGSKKKKEAERAAAEAERQAAEAAAEAEASAAEYGDYASAGGIEGSADAEAAQQAAMEQGMKQLELLEAIATETKAVAGAVLAVKQAVDGNASATYQVRDAVWASAGDTRNALISALSNFG
ncbi:hypothetical protein [Siphonobacter aquaeclarae]|uniref:Uncharacterized protein n=1 Tax=Siphonobacter aquaeclarae TaxID=563176 RepID=A0A1G9T199_9BACT|nr:hypothetical protein [Siphonobacter aquaeclarae]SDM41398.1 hypothetical protein SAMN04488090_3372 [Siphonobacter aquaeclarae]